MGCGNRGMSVMSPYGLSHTFSWNSEKTETKNVFKDLPPQQELKITDYATVHKRGDTGAYVAEVISSQCNIEQSGSV